MVEMLLRAVFRVREFQSLKEKGLERETDKRRQDIFKGEEIKWLSFRTVVSELIGEKGIAKI